MGSAHLSLNPQINMIQTTIKLIQHIFFLVIDISGTIFGASLIYIGWRMRGDSPLPLDTTGWVVIVLGTLSFSIHGTHYIWARIHGSDFFHTTRKEELPYFDK